ncbi:hypothetical protein GCM10011499_22410 [Pelagibacterium lentulum]|uniref:Uncharacterized protein n=1 Tax=Pelagibacterium lentulum TaxID=2029865 RepID=A0A916RF91_9HYPH|nr:hypothetical protein GCM10011499_22410 [Pelagibacterium lentulum]
MTEGVLVWIIGTPFFVARAARTELPDLFSGSRAPTHSTLKTDEISNICRTDVGLKLGRDLVTVLVRTKNAM